MTGVKYFKEGYWSNPDPSTIPGYKKYHMKWTHDDEVYLVSEWNKGTKVEDIAEAFGITKRSVQRHIAANRERLGLNPRKGGKVKQSKDGYSTHFDKLWKGSVPFGHWSITKRWGK